MKVTSLFRPRSYYKVISDARAVWQGRKDRPRAEEWFPGLVPALAGPLRAELQPHYQEYISSISTDRMAVSLPLATFLLWFCRQHQPARVIDLGSGFSSFVLRHHQATAATRPEVWSVDELPFWLDRTREYLSGHGVSAEHLYSWEEFRKLDAGQFDLVLHDLGGIQMRGDTVAAVMAYVRPGGWLVLDDFHRFDYRARVWPALRQRPGELVSMREILRDDLGRYQAVVHYAA